MEEKDRLGDKLRDKEKAAEALYIEQRERERLARLKAAGSAGTVGTSACPRDGDRLVVSSEHGISVHVCPSCNGIWLDDGELETILGRADEASVTRWLRTLLGR